MAPTRSEIRCAAFSISPSSSWRAAPVSTQGRAAGRTAAGTPATQRWRSAAVMPVATKVGAGGGAGGGTPPPPAWGTGGVHAGSHEGGGEAPGAPHLPLLQPVAQLAL